MFEWSVACRVEFTVRPGARTKPSCCSAADRVTGVSELHTNDAKHRTSKVQSVTKHMQSTLFLPDPIARMNVGDAQFLQAVDTFELCTSVGCNCTFSSFFFFDFYVVTTLRSWSGFSFGTKTTWLVVGNDRVLA